MNISTASNRNGLEVAIIGMVGRFPGAKNTEQFWQNLQNGVESIATFTEEELTASGIDPALLQNPDYVKAGALLEDVDCFDASSFGINPRDAEIIDPQQRIFLECSWEALENAGYDSQKYEGLIGVYGGLGMNTYAFNSFDNKSIRNSVDTNQLFIASDKDFLTTRVSYHLDLKGPSVDIQTACSTSLVAVHIACRSLLSGECDIALAGGVTIRQFQKEGYLYQQGSIFSPDGHCRAFDAEAQGTVIGNGVGIVVLKRLEEAIADGDCIHAVIKGSAINNDGALKVSYTAPRMDTQAIAIQAAQTIAEVEPDTITYLEAHGTGTSLGDPIEIAALKQVFNASTQKKNFCAIGSVKTNVGHLDTAAGVTGLIKTILALKYKKIPPSLHFEQPNPKIDFDNSPFYVNTTLSEWNANGTPRRAGVSSFGIGGTNAHVVLEEAPQLESSSSSRPWQLLLLSAKTDSALETATTNLVNHLRRNPHLNLADIAYTFQVGRRGFEHRRMLLCQSIDQVLTALETKDSQQVLTHFQEPGNQQIVFMFPGQGSQYVDMGQELYETELVFRQSIDECCEILKPHLDIDLRTILYPQGERSQAAQKLQQTDVTQPALFVIEYALAQLWMTWGVSPTAMIGHSIGEYVAATLSGVFSLKDALALVAARGKLMHKLPSGEMLSIPLAEEKIQPYLDDELSLAAINAPSLCVVSGSEKTISNLQSCLAQQGVECRRLHTSHAFHSQMMDSILAPFTALVTNIQLNPPQIPFVSNLTGTWITVEAATDAEYWANHLRKTVRFATGMTEFLQQPDQILLEVGPGRTLSTFAKQQTQDMMVLNSMRHPKDKQSDVEFALNTLGQLWLVGVQIDWSSFYSQEQRHRIPLPTYPFEREKYWIEAPKASESSNQQTKLSKKSNITDWFYRPTWKQINLLEPFNGKNLLNQKECWLIFVDASAVGHQIGQRLECEGQEVITVTVGKEFAQLDDRIYVINPRKKGDYDTLFQTLHTIDKIPKSIVHLWSVTENIYHQDLEQSAQEALEAAFSRFEQYQNIGFYSLLFITQALSKCNVVKPIQLSVITNNIHDVIAQEELILEKRTILGPCIVIPQEYPNITCRSIDIDIPEFRVSQKGQLIDQLMAELTAHSADLAVAYRGHHRWIHTFEPIHLKEVNEETTRLRTGGNYLIVGDFIGSLGFIFAEHLVQNAQARPILIGNIGLPERSEWSQWLQDNDEKNLISLYIKKILDLEQSGIDLLMLKANVANIEQMQAAVDQVYEHFDQVHGVFYVTPMSNEKSAFSIQDLGHTESKLQFHSKVSGLYVLERVLKDREIDFCLAQSSLSSIVGGLGLGAYSAGNFFVDSFVSQHNQISSIPWFSINWDIVKFEEESGTDNTPLGATLAELGMTFEEVWDVSQRVLSINSAGQFIVSPADLQNRINTWVKRESFKNVDDSQQQESLTQHSRPNLKTTYVAPENKIEQTIVNIWQELLGVESVGTHDNFFDLGGHSLLAVQVTSRLREFFQVELPLQSILFDAPTIAGLAVIIAETKSELESQEMVGLIQEIKNLSPEELQQELIAD